MSVKIRLKRFGKRGNATYRIVAIDESSKRQGRENEVIGFYDPTFDPPKTTIKADRAKYWLSVGATPTQTVSHLLKKLDK